MKQGKTRDAFPRSTATINQAIGATPSRRAKKDRVAGAERRRNRAIEHEALTDMGFDAEYLYWAGMEDIGCK